MAGEGISNHEQEQSNLSEFGKIQSRIENLSRQKTRDVTQQRELQNLLGRRDILGRQARDEGIFDQVKTYVDDRLDRALGGSEPTLNALMKVRTDARDAEQIFIEGVFMGGFDQGKYGGIVEFYIKHAVEKAIFEYNKSKSPGDARLASQESLFARSDWEYPVDPTKFSARPAGTTGAGATGTTTSTRPSAGGIFGPESMAGQEEVEAFKSMSLEEQRKFVRDKMAIIRYLESTFEDELGRVELGHLNEAQILRRVQSYMKPEIRGEFDALKAILALGTTAKDKKIAKAEDIKEIAKRVSPDGWQTLFRLKDENGQLLLVKALKYFGEYGIDYAKADPAEVGKIVRKIGWLLDGKPEVEAEARKGEDMDVHDPATYPTNLWVAQIAEDFFNLSGKSAEYGNNKLFYLDSVLNIRKWVIGKKFVSKDSYFMSNLYLEDTGGHKKGNVIAPGGGGGEFFQSFMSDFYRFAFWDDEKRGYAYKKDDGTEVVVTRYDDIKLDEINLVKTWAAANKFADYWKALADAEIVKDFYEDILKVTELKTLEEYEKKLFKQFKTEEVRDGDYIRDVAIGNCLAMIFEYHRDPGLGRKSIAQIERPSAKYQKMDRDFCDSRISQWVGKGLLHEDSEATHYLRARYGRPRSVFWRQKQGARVIGGWVGGGVLDVLGFLGKRVSESLQVK